MAFFDDRLAIPDIYGDDHASTVENGVRAVKMDLTPIVTAMGMATSRLGLGATYSTTYYEPFHVARLFATLDLMLGGRTAWNVVTSLNDSEAANFGRSEHLEHDARYDRADEFLEVVMGHWDTWDDDALIVDKQSGRFADAAKVRRLDHDGRFFKSRGPFPVPRSAQGHPVLIQAGQSGRGRLFASRWAELVFAVFPNLAIGRKQYAEMKQAIAAAGRDPASVSVAPAVYAIVAESAAMAEDKRAYIDSLAKPVDGLNLLCEVLNVDFSKKPLDEPFSDEELAGITRLARILRPGRLAQRQAEPVGARLRPLLRPGNDTGIPELRRHSRPGRRPDGGVVRHGLRRVRDRGDAYPGLVRGFRPPGGAGAAAARAVPDRIRRSHAAREPGPQTARDRRVAPPRSGGDGRLADPAFTRGTAQPAEEGRRHAG